MAAHLVVAQFKTLHVLTEILDCLSHLGLSVCLI